MGETIEYERPTHPKLHTHDGLDGSGQVSHASLTGVSADQHHPRAHAHNGTDGSGQVSHVDLVGVNPDQHHPKAHAHTTADGSGQVSHADLTNVGPDQHHAKAHSDADHTGPNRVAVQDEGTAIATRATLNFTGAGVTVSDDAANNRVNIDIPGGSGGGGQVYHAYVFTPRSEALVLQEDWQPVAAHRIPPTGEHGALTPLRFRVRAMNAGGGVNTVVLQTSATLTGARTTRATVALDAAQEAETTAFGTWTPADNEYLWVRATAVGTAPQNLTAELIVKEATF